MHARTSLLAVALAASACSSVDDGGEGPGGADAGELPGTADAGDDVEGEADASAACAAGEPLPEGGVVTIEHGGIERRFAVYVPDGVPEPAPVVLNFHGFTSSAEAQRGYSLMDQTADEHGFVVVYPDGVGNSWNGGACCGDAQEQDLDDVAFVGALLDELERRLCIDSERVYATGFSNGGFLSHRLACELSDRIAGIGPVAGVIGVDGCEPARPRPVIAFHGVLDAVVPYAGSPLLGFPGFVDTMDAWAERNGCSGEPVVVYEEGEVQCVEHQDCDEGAAVRLCSIAGGGHTWPSGTVPPLAGHTTTDVDANAMMWEFWNAR